MTTINAERLSRCISIINSEFNAINQGGCGTFAMALYRTLQQHGVECELVAVCNGWGGADHPEHPINDELYLYVNDGEYGNASPNEHVAVRIGSTVIDSWGVVGDGFMKFYDDPLDPDAFRELLFIDAWNYSFARANCTKYHSPRRALYRRTAQLAHAAMAINHLEV